MRELRSGSGHVLGVEIVFAAGSDRFASDAVTVIVSSCVCLKKLGDWTGCDRVSVSVSPNN